MDDAKLIDLIEAQPCIYDKTHLFYSNKEQVRSIWQTIAGEMQLEVPVCQKRWRYLRDYFVRQLHITESFNNTTINHDDEKMNNTTAPATKRSYWPLYDRLSFLKPFSSTRRRSKRTSTTDITNHNIKTEPDLTSPSPLYSDTSDRTGVSNASTLSGNYHEFPSNLDYLKFYQVMQVAAQRNLSSNDNDKDYGTKIPSKRKRNKEDLYSVFTDCAVDEHDCFFKSLLSSVRRINDEHIIAFRTEILQVIMKYRHLSDVMGNESVDDEEGDDEHSSDNVVVVNTEEAHWRKNLFRQQF